MPITMTCSCGKQLRAADEHAGRRIRCPACGNELVLPVPVISADAAPPRRPERPEPMPPRRPEQFDDREPARTSEKAVISLILGLLSFCFSALTAIPAIILGILGLMDVSQGNGRVKGRGMAISGIVLAVLGSLVLPFFFFVVIPLMLVTAVNQVGIELQKEMERQSARMAEVKGAVGEEQTREHLSAIGVALSAYQDEHLNFPQSAAPQGKMKVSWRVSILPYLGDEEKALYKQYRLNEPWDSPSNKRLLARMPAVYRSTLGDDPLARGETRFQCLTGPGTVMGGDNPVPLLIVNNADGAANTIVVVEAEKSVPWTKPVDLSYDPQKPLPRLGQVDSDRFVALFADGSVRAVRKKVDPRILAPYFRYETGQVKTPLPLP